MPLTGIAIMLLIQADHHKILFIKNHFFRSKIIKCCSLRHSFFNIIAHRFVNELEYITLLFFEAESQRIFLRRSIKERMLSDYCSLAQVSTLIEAN